MIGRPIQYSNIGLGREWAFRRGRWGSGEKGGGDGEVSDYVRGRQRSQKVIEKCGKTREGIRGVVG